MTEVDLIAQLSAHLPDILSYNVRVGISHAPPNDIKIVFRGRLGNEDVIKLSQGISQSHDTARDGDISITLHRSVKNVGTFLGFNNILRLQKLGVQKNEFNSADMGAYVWSHMGALIDANPTDPDKQKNGYPGLLEELPKLAALDI